MSDLSRPVAAAEVITSATVQTLAEHELTVLRATSPTFPSTAVSISVGAFGTTSNPLVCFLTSILDSLRTRGFVSVTPVGWLRTSAGTDELALTKSGVSV